MSLRIGDRVDARYDGRSKWYPGNVSSMNPDGTIDITYDSGMWNGWEGVSEYGVKPGLFKVAGSSAPAEPPTIAPPAPPPVKQPASAQKQRTPSSAIPTSSAGGGGSYGNFAGEFYIGQRVEAKHQGKSKWFGGTLMAVNDDGETFKVCYDGATFNGWLPVTEPKVPRTDVRCYSGDATDSTNPVSSSSSGTTRTKRGNSSASSSFDTSPIRRAKEEEKRAAAAVAAAATKQRKGGAKKGKSAADLLTSPPPAERLTRAQAAAVAAAAAEVQAQEEADAIAAAVAAKAASDAAAGGGGGGGAEGGKRRKSLATFRETKAMRAQREAALKRRETIEANEKEKYGETFESAKQKKKDNAGGGGGGGTGGGAAASTPHTFLKRATSYTARVGATPSGNSVTQQQQGDAAATAPETATSAALQYKQQKQQQQQQQQQQQAKSQVQEYDEEGGVGGGGVVDRQQRAAAVTAQQEKRRQMMDESRPVGNAGGGGGRGGGGSGGGAGGAGGGEPPPPVRVIVRKRPPKEDGSEVDCIKCVAPLVVCYENKVKVDLTKYVHTHKFVYDCSFGEADSTSGLYDESVRDLIDNFIGGGSSTCFCFGQTASGKTFTLFGAGGGQVMEGEQGSEFESDPELGGVYMLAAQDVFRRLEQIPDLCLSVSMFEIYGQKVRDLLNGCVELAALEDGKGVLQLVGLQSEECMGMDDFVRVSNVGRSARSTTATGANATSSRSHAAMLLRLVRRGGPPVDPKTGKPKPSLGKFSLIDLAGSERGADNENTDKVTQMEGRQINQSLLALKEVIRAKELGRSHAPFRQSRLTQVLEESLTGRRCQTVVIGCVSPAEKDIQQSINTLRYAEGLRPGLKKDLAKREKEAFARETAREAAEAQADGEAHDRIVAKQQELAMMSRGGGGYGGSNGGGGVGPEEDYEDDEDAYEDASGGPSPAPPQSSSSFMDMVRGQRSNSSSGNNLDLLEGLNDDDDDDLGIEGGMAVVVDDVGTFDGGRLLDMEAEGDDEDYEDEDGGGYNAYNHTPRKGAKGGGGTAATSAAAEALREADKGEVKALLAKPDKKSSLLLRGSSSGSGGSGDAAGGAKGGKAAGGGGGVGKTAAGAVKNNKEDPAMSTAARIRAQQQQKTAEKKAATARSKPAPSVRAAAAVSEASMASAAAKAPTSSAGGGAGLATGGTGGAVGSPLRKNNASTSYSRGLKSSASANSVLAPASPSRAAAAAQLLKSPTPSSDMDGGMTASARRLSRSSSRSSFEGSGSSSGEGGLLGSAVHNAALERKLAERDAELLEKDGLVGSLQKRLADLNRALEESDAIQKQQGAALKRERERVSEVEESYQEAVGELEGQLEEAHAGRDEMEQELEQREAEVEQLCAEVEDREARIDELKLMLKKMLETSTSNPLGAAAAATASPLQASSKISTITAAQQRKALQQLPSTGPTASGGGGAGRSTRGAAGKAGR